MEDAIKAVVTRSANDAAVVIGEAIGGTESNFAEMMTRKARALGMSNTTFRNASACPTPARSPPRATSPSSAGRSRTASRGVSLLLHRAFVYRGETIGNHNRLMLRMEGVDGIKTGYTNASGFNLVTSLHRDDRFLVGVVLGGSSASSRDQRMAASSPPTCRAPMRRPRGAEGHRDRPARRRAGAAPHAHSGRGPPERARAGRGPLPPPQRVAYAAADR